MLIRRGWAERLSYGAQAPLEALVVPEVRVTGILSGDRGRIAKEEVDFLATVGLPQINGCLYPAIESTSSSRKDQQVFMLGSYDCNDHNAVDVDVTKPSW